jgi:hypothetical protein
MANIALRISIPFGGTSGLFLMSRATTYRLDAVHCADVEQSRRCDMNKLIASLAVLALMTGVAVAATDSGIVKQVDPKTDSITLEDGKTFTWGEAVEGDSLKPGQRISVTYDVKAGKMVASKIEVVK